MPDPGEGLIIRDRASPGLQRIAAQVKEPRALLAVLGRKGAQELKTHFRKKDTTQPNKLGGRRTHYWREVADSTRAGKATARSVTIRIGHPTISQKVYGGQIIAKRAKALTIPMHPDAHGRMASEFDDELFIHKDDQGKGYLARSTGGGIELMYALRKSVNQDPDPTALPNLARLSRKLIPVARKFLDLEKTMNSTQAQNF